MKALLDTHALIWWLMDASTLSKRAAAFITDEANEIFVSAASLCEISTKYRIGRLPNMGVFLGDYVSLLVDEGFMPLSITLAHAHLAGGLEGSHRDPFDRMLIAQALLESMTLISNETLFDDYGVIRIWS